MKDIILQIEDRQAHVTATAIIKISGADVGICIFSPDGGECEIFVDASDVRRIVDALGQAILSVEKNNI